MNYCIRFFNLRLCGRLPAERNVRIFAGYQRKKDACEQAAADRYFEKSIADTTYSTGVSLPRRHLESFQRPVQIIVKRLHDPKDIRRLRKKRFRIPKLFIADGIFQIPALKF